MTNEEARIQELKRYQILDTEPEVEFDDFTYLAAQICQVPIALISLLDGSRQWFKSRYGFEITETPQCQSFCHHAIQSDELFEVEDALEDPRFVDSQLVAGEPHVRFYAGAPLISPSGMRMGTICVLDRVPRKLSPEQREMLQRISRQVMLRIHHRSIQHELENSALALREHKERTEQIIASSLDAVVMTDSESRVKAWNPQAERVFGWNEEEILGSKLDDTIISPCSRDVHGEIIQDFLHQKTPWMDGRRFELMALTRSGKKIPIELTISRIVANGEMLLSKFIRDLSHEKDAELKIKRTSDLLGAVGQLQSRFITGSSADRVKTFEELLKLLLKFTESEYGFIAEVLRDEEGNPYMKTHAITDISWNKATRDLFEKHKLTGLEFRNLKTLFGSALVTGEPVIANMPAHDPRRGGLPAGHPPLNAFLGIPIWQGGDMVAMVGVSNRPGGYDLALVKEIDPLLATYATIIRGFRVEQRQQADQERIEALNESLEARAKELADALETNVRVEREKVEALREHSALLEQRVSERTAELEQSKKQFEDLFEFAPDALVLTDIDGTIQLVNRIAEQIFGSSRQELHGRSVETLLGVTQRGLYREARDRVSCAGQKVALRGLRHSGEEFPLECSISRLGNREKGWVVTAMRDVSERNHLESEVARISSHEQERMSHELHDHLGAYLAGIAFRFKSLAQMLRNQKAEEADIAEELVGQVNDAINQVRNFARILAPVDIETGGLAVALSELGRETKSVFDVESEVSIDGNLPAIGHEQGMQLYRIAQEATRNAIHHGFARKVEIMLTTDQDHLVLSVTNDGRYWFPDLTAQKGMGVRIMGHRAVSMGGMLNIESGLDGHTSVTCKVPLSSIQ